MALVKATFVKDVDGQPWRFSSVAKMKAFNYSCYLGSSVFLESWHEGAGLGSGLFKVSKGTTEVGDDGSVIVADDGTRLIRVFDGPIFADMWGALPSTTYDSLPAVKKAYLYASSKLQQLYLGSGGYIFSGSESLDINQSLGGISALGRARINCTGFTGDYVVTITSSYEYTPAAYYNNLSPALEGLYFYGAKVAGCSGLLCGKRTSSALKSYNGQTLIRGCTFDKFDYNIRFGHNSWRFGFQEVNSLNALNVNGILYAPSGLEDSGEILNFYKCQFFDGAGSNIRISCSSYTMVFTACSFLNITFTIDAGSSTSVTAVGCNFENPGSQSTRRYIEITSGHTNIFNVVGGSVVTNANAGQTQALIHVSANNQINLSNLTIPYGAHYQQEADSGYHAFCSGQGYVSTSNCSLQLLNGAGCCPIHPSLSVFTNWNLSYANLNGWTVDKGSAPTSVAEYLSAQGPKGEGVLHVAPTTQGVNVSQVASVSKPAGSMSMSVMVNIISASANAGQISLAYLDAFDNNLGGVSANLGTTTGWKVIGKNTLRGRLPVGTAKVRLNIQTVAGADVQYTNILCNII